MNNERQKKGRTEWGIQPKGQTQGGGNKPCPVRATAKTLQSAELQTDENITKNMTKKTDSDFQVSVCRRCINELNSMQI